MIAKPQVDAHVKSMELNLDSKTVKFKWSSYPILVILHRSLNSMCQSFWLSFIKPGFSSVFSDMAVTLQFAIGFDGREYGKNYEYNKTQNSIIKDIWNDKKFLGDLIGVLNNGNHIHDYIYLSGNHPKLSVHVSIEREQTIDTVAIFCKVELDGRWISSNVVKSVRSDSYKESLMNLITASKEDGLKTLELVVNQPS